MAYEYITATGIIVPETETIYAEVQAEYLGIFGTDTIITPDTPQGVLATADALARAQETQNNAAVANMINPNISIGVFLDAIMAYTGMQRTAATRTVVPGVALAGVSGTVIPEGTEGSTAAGVLFASLEEVTITAGVATVDFRAVEYGPISCGIGELNQIVSNVNGWETVTNPQAGIIGQDTQADQAARAKRNNTISFQGVALPEAITSSLYNVEGVTSLWFQENYEGTTETINGISMLKNSIFVCVDGGADLDIAAVLLENKSLGCNWIGDEVITVIDPATSQPYLTKFQRPDRIEFLVRVTSPNGDEGNIKAAILAWQAGQVSGMEGLKVASDVSPFEIAGAINNVYPETFVSKVEISLVTPVSYSTDVLEIAVDEIAFTAAGDITVVTP